MAIKVKVTVSFIKDTILNVKVNQFAYKKSESIEKENVKKTTI